MSGVGKTGRRWMLLKLEGDLWLCGREEATCVCVCVCKGVCEVFLSHGHSGAFEVDVG